LRDLAVEENRGGDRSFPLARNLIGSRAMRLVLFSLAAVGFATARPAAAQCPANASSCITCHETRGARPVLQSGQIWHADHSFGDLCAGCHGGDREAVDADAAHLVMRTNPVDDPSASCAGCHDDHAARADRYRPLVALAEQARSRPPPPPSSSPALAATTTSIANIVLAIAAVVLAFVLYLLRARLVPAGAPRRSLRAWLTATSWSPYVAGAGLGILVAISEGVCGRPLFASGAFDKLAAYVGKPLFPSSQYYQYVISPGFTWPVWLMVGVLGGSFLSSRLSGETRLRWLPDTQWEPRFGPSRTLRFALAFFGAALVQIGAGIAGGCTSGLAISGGAVLAPAAFMFMAGMFAGGIPTALLWYRGRRDI